MILDIDYHSGVPIYRQIIDQIREQIIVGILNEGDQLISIRELSSKLSINPMTISKAYSAMEAEGLLERRRGIGLFIIGPTKEQKEKNKEDIIKRMLDESVLIAMQFGISEEKVKEILEKSFIKHQSNKRNVPNE